MTPPSTDPRTPSLLRRPAVATMLGLCLFGRLPTSMAPLALLLAVRLSGGSYRTAGVLVAVYTAGLAVSGPLVSRLTDRTNQTVALVSTGVLGSVGFLVTALTVGGDVGITTIAVGLAGLATPPLEPCLRTLWPDLVPAAELRNAYTLEAATQELIFVGGPLLVAASGLVDPSAPLHAAAAITAIGALGFASREVSRRWQVAPRPGRTRPPLSVPTLRAIYLGVLFVGAPFGAFTLGVTSFAEGAGLPGAAAWIMAAQATGSLAGGLVIMRFRRLRSSNLPLLTVVLAAAMAPLALVDTVPALVVAAAVAGLPLAAVLGEIFARVEHCTPPGRDAEAVGWVVTSFVVGGAVATVVSGWLEEGIGVHAVLAIPVISLAVAAVLLSRTSVRR